MQLTHAVKYGDILQSVLSVQSYDKGVDSTYSEPSYASMEIPCTSVTMDMNTRMELFTLGIEDETNSSRYDDQIDESSFDDSSRSSLNSIEHIEDILDVQVIFDSKTNSSQNIDNDDSEIEVVFDSKMPPLIPITFPEQTFESNLVLNNQPLKFYKATQPASSSSLSQMTSNLISILECPVCSVTINASPIHCCPKGHISCLSCWTTCHVCPLCRTPWHEEPHCFAHTANMLLQLLRLPCEFEYKGCIVKGTEEFIKKHQFQCPYREDDRRTQICSSVGCRVGKE